MADTDSKKVTADMGGLTKALANIIGNTAAATSAGVDSRRKALRNVPKQENAHTGSDLMSQRLAETTLSDLPSGPEGNENDLLLPNSSRRMGTGDTRVLVGPENNQFWYYTSPDEAARIEDYTAWMNSRAPMEDTSSRTDPLTGKSYVSRQYGSVFPWADDESYEAAYQALAKDLGFGEGASTRTNPLLDWLGGNSSKIVAKKHEYNKQEAIDSGRSIYRDGVTYNPDGSTTTSIASGYGGATTIREYPDGSVITDAGLGGSSGRTAEGLEWHAPPFGNQEDAIAEATAIETDPEFPNTELSDTYMDAYNAYAEANGLPNIYDFARYGTYDQWLAMVNDPTMMRWYQDVGGDFDAWWNRYKARTINDTLSSQEQFFDTVGNDATAALAFSQAMNEANPEFLTGSFTSGSAPSEWVWMNLIDRLANAQGTSGSEGWTIDEINYILEEMNRESGGQLGNYLLKMGAQEGEDIPYGYTAVPEYDRTFADYGVVKDLTDEGDFYQGSMNALARNYGAGSTPLYYVTRGALKDSVPAASDTTTTADTLVAEADEGSTGQKRPKGRGGS